MLMPLHLVWLIIILSIGAADATRMPRSKGCSRVTGNMMSTRGCHVFRPRNSSITIDCDGKNADSVKNILRKFQNFGCNLPVKLHISDPRFPITSQLFGNAGNCIYRLEIHHITIHQSWDNVFGNLGSLRVLSLHFSLLHSITREPAQFFADAFRGLDKIEYVRLSARGAPVILHRNVFAPLSMLKCLALHGVTFPGDFGGPGQANWIYPNTHPMITQYEDPISHRSEKCDIL